MIHQKIGLVGHEISYSLSQALHIWTAGSLGIEGACYEIMDVHPDAFQNLKALVVEKQITALNITTPYKRTIKEVLGKGRGFTAGSCNVAWQSPSDQNWKFADTDGEGFIRALKKAGVDLGSIQQWAFLGCGGVVHSVLQRVLADEKLARVVHIFARSWKSLVEGGVQQELLSSWGAEVHFHPFSPTALLEYLKDHSGVFLTQATPLPHQGEAMELFAEVACSQVSSFAGFMEMTYAGFSALENRLRSKGKLPTVTGIAMLVEQALLAQQIWWGKQADAQKLLEYMNRKLNELVPSTLR